MLTTYGDEENVWDAFHAGASAFLLKTTTASELVHAVRSVAAGTELLAPEVTRRLVRQFMAKPRPGHTPPGLAQLTDRERDVFQHLAVGLSNTDIARAMFISEATVKTHINRLFTKLGARDRVQAVIYAYESGFVTPGAPSSH